MELAMLRGKNIHEAVFWSDKDPGANEAGAMVAWLSTSEIIRQVYSPRLYEYKDALGTFSSTEGADHDNSRLDFTLRSNGADKVVEMSAPLDAGTSSVLPMTQMLVYFNGLDDWSEGYTDLDFVVECEVNRDDILGMVLIRDWTSNPQWHRIEISATEGTTYGFYTPADATGRHQSRRVFRVSQNPGLLRLISTDGEVELKLIHFRLGPTIPNGTLVSRYDLVQVIPSPTPVGSGLAPISLPQSDVNLDEVIDEADLTAFLMIWMQGEKAADVDMDGEITEIDLCKYLGHYINEN